MRGFKFDISAGGVLLLAALYFFMDGADFLALMLAAAAHELGHLLALRLCGARARKSGALRGFPQRAAFFSNSG